MKKLLDWIKNHTGMTILICVLVAIVTVIIISIEAWDRGSRRDHKQDMDRHNTLK